MEFVIAWLNSPGILILRLQDVPFESVPKAPIRGLKCHMGKALSYFHYARRFG